MKTNIFLLSISLLVMLFFTRCADENSTNETPQGLGKALFDALQADDKEAFDEYFFRQTDRDDLLTAIKNDDRLTNEVKNQSQELILTFLKPDPTESAGSFAKIREEALKCGLQDWSEAEFVTSTFDQDDDRDLKVANVKAMFRYKGLDYSLRISRSLQTERGWLLLDKPSLYCNN